MNNDLITAHARRFAWRAQHIYGAVSSANASPLYAHLSLQIADDPEILQLVVDADRHTTVANLLFGAVHYLLLGGIAHPLAEVYPSLTENPKPVAEAYLLFRAFCLEQVDAIQQLVMTRTVQTNEVQRCTGLLPGFTYLAQRLHEMPLSLIEVGASLGLNLLWDRYHYHYQNIRDQDTEHVNTGSLVLLACEVNGENRPPIPTSFPKIASRIGIELMPVDLYDEEAIRWIRALIWPEHLDRARIFAQALAVAQANPPPILAGNMVERLPEVLANVPADNALCLYHSYTLNQCPQSVGEAIHELLLTHSQQRPLYRLVLEWYNGQAHPHLDLYTYRDGSVTQELLAYCESHGRWIEWVAATNTGV